MGLGFFGEVGIGEELGDFLFFCGEGFEVGNALELLGGEGGLWGWRGDAGEVAGGAGVESEEAGLGETLDGFPCGFVDDLELGGISPPVGFIENFRYGEGAGGVAENGEEDGGGIAGEHGFLAMDEGGAEEGFGFFGKS